ncbi:MAG: hypothetical protein RLY35_711 [Bacteroidota bacterium]|jgi:hypothetical protein
MRKTILFAILTLSVQFAFAQYKVVTVIESIIPMGMGRSRMIEATTEVDYNAFTTLRTDGKDTKQGDVERGDIKVAGMRETKMLNYFSGVGINFQNIASNDAIIMSKLNEMDAQGYDLAFVASGVESDGGKEDGQGIFVTRMFFKKRN